MHVTAPRADADLEANEQCLERAPVGGRHADEEEDAAALACPSLREKPQSLMNLWATQIAAQHGLPVRDPTAHLTDAGDLGHQRRRWGETLVGVTEPRKMRLELATQMEASGRLSHARRCRSA